MLIPKREIKALSQGIRKIIDGQDIDLRGYGEGLLPILKNDIHTLANLKNEQVRALRKDRDMLKDTLADISHQLKTPLTSLLMMAELLENSLTEPDTEKQAEFIANIRTGLVRMDFLVSTLLKMAKLNAGAIEFSAESIPSDDIITLALEPLGVLLDIKNQSIAQEGGVIIRCDKRWSAEALINILKNASEYSPDGGTIIIKAGENPICAWISVTDSGTGIPASELPGLFRRFEGSRSGAGFGIGLPLALAIMRGQNGDISIENGGNGIGATFLLKFYK